MLIMGYLPWEMRDNPIFWAKHVHPEDAERVFREVKRLIGQGGGTVEYRFRHRRGHYVWVQDSFTVVPDKEGRPKISSVPGLTSPTASAPRAISRGLPRRWSGTINLFARPSADT